MEQIKHILLNSHKNNYIGENITQLEHALSSAYEAEKDNPNDKELIIACLLHDIGHQLNGDDLYYLNENLGKINHEKIGSEYLNKLGFSERICSMVENHVNAKRYICSTNRNYKLSSASSKTLCLQGGLMSENELKQFENHIYFNDFIKLRKYDDLGKYKLNCDLNKLLDHYLDLIVLH